MTKTVSTNISDRHQICGDNEIKATNNICEKNNLCETNNLSMCSLNHSNNSTQNSSTQCEKIDKISPSENVVHAASFYSGFIREHGGETLLTASHQTGKSSNASSIDSQAICSQSLADTSCTDSDTEDDRASKNNAVKNITDMNTDMIEHFENPGGPFWSFRLMYLVVHVAIMLADGLQGTHLYVLYEGYGYSVATLYSLGFVSGAITSPIIGPIVDKIGRKRAAMVYCFLEIIINQMEQYPVFLGLILSRAVGGITTNLLFSVFESWLVTEHRKRGFSDEQLEIILRDSVILSNTAAIASGYLAHCLAANFGAVGPFQGAVACTFFAFALVSLVWSENYGSSVSNSVSFQGHMRAAFKTIVQDSKISRIGLIQGLTEGTLQTFVFLWSPALKAFATKALPDSAGLDQSGEPAYGLIFGALMACGVVGGVFEPTIRKSLSSFLGMHRHSHEDNFIDAEREVGIAGVAILCAMSYFLSALLLLTPFLINVDNPNAFSFSLAAFLIYELLIGLYMPCEGVLRSIFMPNQSICSLMTMLRVIVNVSVALGVMSTNYIPFASAFAILSIMMTTAGLLQLSLVPKDDWVDIHTNLSISWSSVAQFFSSTRSQGSKREFIPALTKSSISNVSIHEKKD